MGEKPSRIPAADLGSVFGPPDRSAGLSGRLQSPPRPEPASRPADDPGATPKGAAPKAPRRRARGPAAAAPAVPIQVIVYLPVSLKDKLRDAARSSDSTYTAIALAAVDATHTQLGVLLDTGRRTDLPREGSLFSAQPTAPAQQNREAQVQVSLRTVRRDVDVIDDLARSHAVSRSALITAALTAHLQEA